jgi:maltooligosyltrehalose trehalohydrolase
LICWQRWQANSDVLALMNFQPEVVTYQPVLDGRWQRRLDSADSDWLGPGAQSPVWLETAAELKLWPQSFVLYERIDTDSPR